MDEDDKELPLAVETNDGLSQRQRQDTEKVAKDSEPSFGVTIITSYLGASNSTLINCVLNPQHGKRIEVISNEFGVERPMINERRGVALAEEVVELANDRICCITKHGLVQAREQLIQRRSGEITCWCQS
uniref:CobW/HypB/UreG nucleotide-binding domain-containing protein n=1 Tax=Kalanchoe fedtschenkoi TaxID=63787 RepID=A0A7N0U4I6_KALFE